MAWSNAIRLLSRQPLKSAHTADPWFDYCDPGRNGSGEFPLFYSNRRPEDAGFLDGLQALQKVNPRYQFIPTMTEVEKSQRDWKGETGYINRAMLLRHLPSLQGPIYYIAGPPAMVTAMRQMMADAG